MVELQTLKNDLIANQKKFDETVIKRNALNIELIGIEFIIRYIRELIAIEEKEPVKKEEKKPE